MYIVLIVVLLGLSIYKVRDQLAPESPFVALGKGTIKDSESTLLARIEWGNKFSYRINHQYRFVLLGIVLSLFMSVIWEGSIKINKVFVRSVLICFTLLTAFHNYFNIHSDKFHRAYIDENVKYLRRKKGLKREKTILQIPIKNRLKYFYYEL